MSNHLLPIEGSHIVPNLYPFFIGLIHSPFLAGLYFFILSAQVDSSYVLILGLDPKASCLTLQMIHILFYNPFALSSNL